MHEERPILNQLNIVTGDMMASVAFYRLLGVNVSGPFKGRSGEPFHTICDATDPVDFDLDAPRFARGWNSGWSEREEIGGRVVIGFRIASREAVDDLYEKLTGAGHKGLQPPYDAFWGARYAIVEDPNGIAVGLMSERDASRRTAPPGEWTG